jgi:predicted dehydrogenase
MATGGGGNWRSDARLGGVSRAFGDIGVHWCDLMEFTTVRRITRLNAVLGSAASGRRSQEEDGGVVTFETDRGALGSVVVSQVSRAGRTGCGSPSTAVSAPTSSTRSCPSRCGSVGWRATASSHETAPRMHPWAARYSRLPAGHPQGCQEVFDAFVADVHKAARSTAPDGLPTFEDGLRAAHLTDAVLQSAALSLWVEVPRGPEAEACPPSARGCG